MQSVRSDSPVDAGVPGPGTPARPYLDVAAAVVVIGVFWLPPVLGTGSGPRAAAGLVLAAVTGVAMALRRHRPAAAACAAGAATLAGTALGVCQDPMLAASWCLYPLAITRAPHTRTIVVVLAGVAAGLAAVTAVPQGDAGDVGQRLVLSAAALSVSWLLGVTTGRQIAAAREAERARVRLAVARDVHDVVGHALGVIGAEAGVTRSLPDADERELRASLADIERHARRALEEVQALVRALRAPGPAEPPPGTAPDGMPGAAAEARPGKGAGLAGLPSLIAATRAAGVRVDGRVQVRADEVSGMVGTVLYRIVQEALSNVVRHAPGAACAVDVYREGGVIVARVRDHGPGAARPGGPGAGTGLLGMRERARLVGGTVTWGDHPEGGFEVTARLPAGGAR